ncbi:MAG: hypothetical protein WCZ89_04795, partial [Phycisphaerae bacterium]
SERYYNHSISLLIAFRMINSSEPVVKMLIDERRRTMPYEKHDLIDYVKFAVRAARSLFDRRVAHSHLERIRTNLQPGLTPLGAEIELSNVGFAAVEPFRSRYKVVDTPYDGFKYFHDFRLNILMWKLGGYIDDHSGSADIARKRGYLELAPGRLSLAGELSRAATADPWVLNNLIHEIILFYDVKPHSLHLSYQLRRNQMRRQKTLPLGYVKCLLALGGGLSKSQSGKLWLSRIGQLEIIPSEHGEEFVFSRCSKRNWYMGDVDLMEKAPQHATAYVQQYKFIRLEEKTNYEPLIMCLKGLQMAYNPGDYLTVKQLRNSPVLRRQYETLKKWGLSPTEINSETINEFIKTVRSGLMSEGHRQPVHKPHYIEWTVSEIQSKLNNFNEQIRNSQTSPDGQVS